MANEKTRTYEDCINELKTIEKELEENRSKRDSLDRELDKIATFEKMTERFGKFGKVEHAKYSEDFVLKTVLLKDEKEVILSTKSTWRNDREWCCDDIQFGSLLRKIDFCASSIEELNNDIKRATDNINAIVKESESGNHKINNTINERNNCNDKINELTELKDALYEEAKECWIRNKYGEDGTLAPYFLKNKAETETLGLVKIVKCEESGLGYTVDDIESGRRYYHVAFYRLKEDLRGFPSKYDIIEHKEDEE